MVVVWGVLIWEGEGSKRGCKGGWGAGKPREAQRERWLTDCIPPLYLKEAMRNSKKYERERAARRRAAGLCANCNNLRLAEFSRCQACRERGKK